MKEKNFSLFIILIIFVFIILRFVDLGVNGMHRDELANGLDAYMLGINGTNVYGQKLPFLFNLHGIDLLEPMFKYSLIPFVFIFERSAFGVRSLSGVIAIFTILFTGMLSFEMFKNKNIALFSSFFLAVSPWYFIYNRIGYRANLVPLFFVLSIFLLFKSFKVNKYFPLACLFFGLTSWTYSVTRMTLPLILITLCVIYFKEVIKINKYFLILGCLIFLLTIIPVFNNLLQNQNFSVRANEVTIFNNPKFIELLFKNVYSYFSVNYLFIDGDSNNTRSAIVGVGLENPATILLFIVFIIFLIKKKTNFKHSIFLLSWFVIGISPGFVTEPEHSLRTIGVLPSIQIGASLALFTIITKYNGYNFLFLKSTLVFATLFGFYFLFQYFGPNVTYASKMFSTGLDEAVIYANKNFPKEKIVYGVSVHRPHVYQLFYGQNYSDFKVSYISQNQTNQCNVAESFRRCYESEDYLGKGFIFIERASDLNGLDGEDHILYLSKDRNGEDLYAVIK